ncbi:hypothetical protein ABBQ32_010593 [Trebouxia sp. C0010 RCD-2024]
MSRIGTQRLQQLLSVFAPTVTSSSLRCATQLATGQLLVALPVLISYPNFLSKVAWIATINYPAPMYLIAADKHTSTLIMANLQTTGDMCLGAVMAGVVVQLAHLPGHAYTTFLCIFTALGFIPFAMSRVRMPAPGMMSTLMFGICISLGQFTPKHELWKTVTGYLVLINIITGAGAIIPAMLIAPTTARQEAKQLMYRTTQDLGQKISSYASALFQLPRVSAAKALPMVRDPSRCLDYTPDLQSCAVASGTILQPFSPSTPTSSPDADTISTSPQQDRLEPEKVGQHTTEEQMHACVHAPPSADSIRQGILEETQPHRLRASHGHPQTSINSLRPSILKAQRLMQETQFELWVPVNHRSQLRHWTAVTHALDHVILTAAALESVLEGEAPLLDQGSLYLLLERVGVLADFQLVYSQLAASCSAMAAAVASFQDPKQAEVASGLLLNPAWAALEHELAQAVQQAIHGYWRHWRESHQNEDMWSPEVQSRALLYLFTLTHSVMEAMAAAEQAIEQATGTTSMATAPAVSKTAAAAAATATATAPTATQTASASALPLKQSLTPHSTSNPQPLPQSMGQAVSRSVGKAQHAQHGHMDPLQEALQLQHHSQTPPEEEGQEDDTQPLIASPQGLLQVSIDQRPAKQYFDRRGVEVHLAINSHQQVQHQLLKARGCYHLRWLGCQLQLLWPILKALVSYKIWSDWVRIPGEAWTVLKTRTTRAELLRSRAFQYGVKYWTCNALVLCVALIVSEADKPDHLASWHPLFLVATVNVVFSEKVDATLAKSVQRVAGSVIGAVYAFLVMLRPRVAGNPYAVAVMCCFSAFMCGLLVEHRFKYGAFLALYTSAVVMLAQYNSTPGNHGSVKFFYARILDIFLGTVITAIFSFVLPWYAREDAMSKLGSAIADGAQLIEQLYLSFYQELQKPLLAGSATAAGSDTHTHGQTGQAADLAARNGAVAKGVAGVLAGVQAQVAKEQVVWKAGPLVMAPLVQSSLAASQVMLERIAALEAMVQQAPIVSGRFTAAPFLYLAQPLHQDMSAAVTAAAQLGRAIKEVLCAPPSRQGLTQPLEKLRACIRKAVDTRWVVPPKQKCYRGADHRE